MIRFRFLIGLALALLLALLPLQVHLARPSGAFLSPLQTSYPFATDTPNPYPDGSPSPTAAQPTAHTPTLSPTVNAPASQTITPQPEDFLPGTPVPGAGDATATLKPFPTMTIEFPKGPISGRLKEISRSPFTGFEKPPVEPGAVERLMPIGLVLVIWVLLGLWFYFTLQRLEP